MNKKFSITDVLAAYFLTAGSMNKPQNSAVLVSDVQKIIKNASENHPELQFIEKTYRGKRWNLNSTKEFALQLKSHFEEKCPDYFKVINWGVGVPVVKCNLDDAKIRNLWDIEKGKLSPWTNSLSNISQEENEIFSITLKSFKEADAETIAQLASHYNGQGSFK